MSLEIVKPDTSNEMGVISYLEGARQWLSTAVEMTSPQNIALVKAQIATAAVATKQLNLSKEIQLDAVEMVRRAEYALAKAIRKGQEEGTVRTRGQHGVSGLTKNSTSDFASDHELHGNAVKGAPGILDLADEAEEEGAFDTALDEAKAEGNLSRANVVRKIRGQSGHVTREQRAEMIRDLAAEGFASRQMASKAGVSAETVRLIARDYAIDIPADRVTAKRHGLNSQRVLENVAESVAVSALAVQQINPLELDQEVAQEWIDSLTESSRALSKAIRKIKESFHVQD